MHRLPTRLRQKLGGPPHVRGPTTRESKLSNTDIQRRDTTLSSPRAGTYGSLHPPFEEGETDYRCEPRPSKPYASLNTDSLRRDVQLFIKKLRYELTTRNPHAKVRYYAVGEYGERFKRPHYHIALFGEDFSDDRKYWRTSGAHPCYRSSRLERLWTDSKGRSLGNSEIGELTIDSAAYIAAYVLKKVNGKMADEHYRETYPTGR